MSAQLEENMILADSLDTLYPQETWYCLAAFIFTVAIFQCGSFLHSKFARPRSPQMAVTDPENSSPPMSSGISLRRLSLAIVNAYRVVAFRWTFEVSLGSTYTLNVAEACIAVAYIVFLFTWTFITTTDLEGNRLSVTYWSGRAGMIAASQLPLITALGTKNNVVSLITGVSHEKLNVVHRMMARVVFAVLLVHGGGESWRFRVTFIDFMRGHIWLQCGIVAITAFFLLCIVSLRPVRSTSYEVFYFAHFTLVLIFLLAAYFHTYGAGMGVYWVWPSLVLWALDRIIRVCRLVIFNHSYFGFKSGSGTMDASTELLSDHLVRLRLKRPSHFHWGPGQTAYLIMPSVSNLPFEAHPFTIASLDSSRHSTSSSTVASSREGSIKANDLFSIPDASTLFWEELVFLVNVREGFTKHLKEVAAKNGKVKVFVDGPYGSSPDLGSYGTSVLIAGGSGVSYTLPVLLDIIEHVRNGQSSCRRVVFIWSIRDASHIHWIDEALIKAIQLAPAALAISIQIYTTRAPSSFEEDDSVNSESPSDPVEKITDSLFKLSAVKVYKGRADLDALLKEEVATASGRMSVNVCGSQPISQSVRQALRLPISGPGSVLRGGPSVTLYVESFGYA